MSYDEKIQTKKVNPAKVWMIDYISDWFGLFDIVIGILTLTIYYPNTQGWWLRRCGR